MTFTPQQIALAKKVPKMSPGYYELIRQGYDPNDIGTEITARADYTPTDKDLAGERVARYSKTQEEDPLTKFQRENFEGLRKTPLTGQEEQKIREETRARMQTRIDAVNEVYGRLISKEQEAGKERIGQTRALAARSGTLGSDFGYQALETTRGKNVEVERAVEAERGLKIQEVLGEIDESAAKEIKAQQEEARGNAKSYIEYLSGVREKATANVKDLATAGFLDLSQLSETQYKNLLSTTGKSALELEAFFNANKPKAEKIDYKSEKVGNQVLLYGVNSKGELVTKKFDADLGENEEIKIIDEVPYAMTRDASGKLQLRPVTGFTPKPKEPKKPTEGESEKDAVKGMSTQLNSVTGADGFISPDDYKKARKAWVSETGMSAKSFDENFSSYRNSMRPSEDYGVERK